MNTEGDKRIVIVASIAAKVSGEWDPTNLQGDNGYARFKFYGNSKLYNVSDCFINMYMINICMITVIQIMTMYALQRRAVDCGITVSSIHPGLVQ